jgi:hypothetical protein
VKSSNLPPLGLWDLGLKSICNVREREMKSRHRGQLTPISQAAAAAYETLEARLLLAYVNVNTESPAQTIQGIGGNYAAWSLRRGKRQRQRRHLHAQQPFAKARTHWHSPARLGSHQRRQQREQLQLGRFKQTGGSLNVLQLMSDLKTRGIPCRQRYGMRRTG